MGHGQLLFLGAGTVHQVPCCYASKQRLMTLLSLCSHLQVPFVAQYRKEKCGELLVVRSSDEPKTTHDQEASLSYPAGSMKVRGAGGGSTGPGRPLCPVSSSMLG